MLLFLFVGFVFSHFFFHYAKVFPIDVELYVFCFALYSSQIQTVFVGKIVALSFRLVCLKRWHWFLSALFCSFIRTYTHTFSTAHFIDSQRSHFLWLPLSFSFHIFILAVHNGGKKKTKHQCEQKPLTHRKYTDRCVVGCLKYCQGKEKKKTNTK